MWMTGASTSIFVSTHDAVDLMIDTILSTLDRSRTMVALVVTGGGSAVIPRLLARPGASQMVLDAQVPYTPRALTELLGRTPASFCSSGTAKAIARQAYQRALRLRATPNTPVLGLGATAALATRRPRRGPHAIHVAVADGINLWESTTRLSKNTRSRETEEGVAEMIILSTLANAMGADRLIDLALENHDEWNTTLHKLAHPRDVIERGEQPWATVDPEGIARPGGAVPGAVVPGSFNPHHHGHTALLEAARQRTDGPVAYEISIANVDKPTLSCQELDARLGQFRGRASVVLTRAPTFVEKGRMLPGTAFAMGVDTASRILQPKYYGNNLEFERALFELRELGVQFFVAGRSIRGRYIQLGDLNMPEAARGLFHAIPSAEVRVDMSSTELRGSEKA